MPIQCNAVTLDEAIKNALEDPKTAAAAARLQRVTDRIRAKGDEGKMLRTLLGFDPELGGHINNTIRAWIMDVVPGGPDIHKRFLVEGDLNILEQKIESAQGVIESMGKSTSLAELRGHMLRWRMLPHESFRKYIPGGSDLWRDMSVENARRNAKIDNVTAELKALGETLGRLSGVKTENVSRQVGRIEKELSAARTMHDAMRRSAEGKFSAIDLAKARQRVERAEAEYRQFKHGGGDETDGAGRLFADLVKALEGKYGPPQKAAQILQKHLGNKATRSDAEFAINQTLAFLENYGTMAREATDKARANLEAELTLVRGMPKHEAQEIAARVYNFKEEEHYYPRINLLNHNRVTQIVAKIRQASSLLEVRQAMRGLEVSHQKERSREFGTLYSHNVPEVLRAYANDIIFSDYANTVGLIVNNWTARLRDSQKVIGDRSWHHFMDASIRTVVDFANEMVYNKEASVADNAIRSLVALKAAKTMWFGNFATAAVNFTEGSVHLVTKVGLRQASRYLANKESMAPELAPYLKGEHQRITSAESYYGERPSASSMRALRGILGEEELRAAYDVESATADRWAELTAEATSKLASKVLVVQRGVENVLRQTAFKVGAHAEFESLDRFEPFFESGDLPAHMIRKYGFNVDRFRNEKEYRASCWHHFVKKRVTAAGYDLMSATQWQYDAAARHLFEHWRPGEIPVGKALMMFQHYPLNWIAAYRLGLENMAAVAKNGGFKSIFKPTSRDQALGKHVNSEAMYYMAMGSAHVVAQAMRWASPVILGSLFSHPVHDMVSDFIEYFTADDEEKKRAFYGRGVMNQLLGPYYTDFTDHVMPAIGAGVNAVLMDTGELPEWMHEAGRVVTGVDWSERAMDEYHDAGVVKSTADSVVDVFLWGNLGGMPRWKRLFDAYRTGSAPEFMWRTGEMFGPRANLTGNDRGQKSVNPIGDQYRQ